MICLFFVEGMDFVNFEWCMLLCWGDLYFVIDGWYLLKVIMFKLVFNIMRLV